MAKMCYQGHASFRVTSNDGTVIYVDPFAGGGYDAPAGIILVTHQHGDHNQIQLVTQKPECQVITNTEALVSGKHQTFSIKGINIESVAAGNRNHDPNQCVGYILTVDGVKIYAAGDTSKTGSMETFSAMKLDYALLPIDGHYNMGLDEAAECARLISARHTIPYHTKPGELFDREYAEMFCAPNRMILEPGQEIEVSTVY